MPRSLATLTIAFGLVAIPVKLYSATRRSVKLRFQWVTPKGEPVRQELVADPGETAPMEGALADSLPTRPTLFSVPRLDDGRGRGSEAIDTSEDEPDPQLPMAGREWPGSAVEAPVSRSQAMSRSTLSKALELEPGKFVLFTPAELKALETPRRDSIDLVSFVPPHAVDPIYVEKSYFLAPAAGAERAYSLLIRALQQTGRCALARWAWRGGEHPALLRPWDQVLVLHQLHAGDAVRTPSQFDIEDTAVSEQELDLAVRLVAGSAQADFDPMEYLDPARQRILDAAYRKLAGGKVIERQRSEPAAQSGAVVDLMAALKASLKGAPAAVRQPPRRASSVDVPTVVRRRS